MNGRSNKFIHLAKMFFGKFEFHKRLWVTKMQRLAFKVHTPFGVFFHICAQQSPPFRASQDQQVGDLKIQIQRLETQKRAALDAEAVSELLGICFMGRGYFL